MLVKYFAGKIVITLCLFLSTIINAEHLDSELNLEQFLDDKGFVRIDYMKLPTHHALVEASINGKSGYFIIDTGAQATVIHHESAEKFSLVQENEAPSTEATGVGGSITTRSYLIESLIIEGNAVSLSSVYSMDLSHVVDALNSFTEEKIDGVLGQDIMEVHEAIIDTASNTVYLKL
jgi:hypothetical protein